MSVDYLKDITPSNYFLWTSAFKDPLTSEQWTSLAATSMEWVLLSRSAGVVLGVKGVKGGEPALMSSFALSAAAFGPARGLEMLAESAHEKVAAARSGQRRDNGLGTDGCHWQVTWGEED